MIHALLLSELGPSTISAGDFENVIRRAFDIRSRATVHQYRKGMIEAELARAVKGGLQILRAPNPWIERLGPEPEPVEPEAPTS